MSTFSLVKSGTTNYITSTRISSDSYKFASLEASEYYMQGFNNNILLDLFDIYNMNKFINIAVN